MSVLAHTLLSLAKVPLAAAILAFTSAAVPPVLVILAPRYVKLSTDSPMFSVIGGASGERINLVLLMFISRPTALDSAASMSIFLWSSAAD